MFKKTKRGVEIDSVAADKANAPRFEKRKAPVVPSAESAPTVHISASTRGGALTVTNTHTNTSKNRTKTSTSADGNGPDKKTPPNVLGPKIAPAFGKKKARKGKAVKPIAKSKKGK